MLRSMVEAIVSTVPCFVAGGGRGFLQGAEKFAGCRLWPALQSTRQRCVEVVVARVVEPSFDSTHSVEEKRKPAFLDSKRFHEGGSVARWRHLHETSSVTDMRPVMNAIAKRASLSTAWLLPLEAASLVRASAFHALNTMSLVTMRAFAQKGYSLVQTSVGLTIQKSYVFYYETCMALQDDIERVRNNMHKQPWDMTFHPSVSGAMRSLRRAVNTIKEADSMVSAMRQGSTSDMWLRGDPYPEYYRYSYHYQTDGWLSSRSAEAYELITEVLFSWRQDAMQRVTFHALTPYLRAQSAHDPVDGNPVVVEIGAGTGRFATFVRDNFRNIELHVSDLSPFYLQNARENMIHWETTVKPDKTCTGRTFFVQANAEHLPFANASVDVLYSIYLMHELPPQVRRAVVAEAARILRKGGLFIITDSTQLGDRPSLDNNVGNFSKLNEPWYESYLTEDFGHLVTKGGAFIADRKEMCSVTKMLSFIRA